MCDVEKEVQFYSFACVEMAVPELFVEKFILSPLSGLGPLSKNQIDYKWSFIPRPSVLFY